MTMHRFLLIVLFVALVAAAVLVVWTRHEHRSVFIELSRLENQRDEMNINFGRLQIEQATWSETNRVEQEAIARLRMVFPNQDEIRVIQP